jgi:phosphate ABC transporter phosphate-binding protein
MPARKKTRALLGTARSCSAALLVLLSVGAGISAQTASTLAQVKKVYVEPLGAEDTGNRLRERLIEDVRKRGHLEVVGSAGEADAVMKGNCGIWVSGYVSNDFHSPSNTRRPVFTGFLSAELVGRAGEPLWSYLVTPSRFRIGTVTNDLADRLVKRLADDLGYGGETGAAAPALATARAGADLKAAGATFPAPLYLKWFESFAETHAGTRVAYSAVGSDAGIRLLLDGKVDFAGSDMPLSDDRGLAKGSVLHLATVLGAVVPIYNLKRLDGPLNFTPEVLVGIYLGKIRKWNDGAIRAANRNAALPESDIVVVHRSDGSGTTFVWTDYLSKVSADWKASLGAASTVQWPVGTAAAGNEGVAETVQRTANAIGYVELVYALRHRLNYGAVRNAAGEFVQADLASLTAAGNQAAAQMSGDFRVSITNPAGKGAYPIASFTWWLLPKDAAEAKRAAEVELLQWVLTSGQKECSALGYAPLPKAVASRELQAVSAWK